MGTKWQQWLWHIGFALLIGVVVFVTSVLASWIRLRDPGVASMKQRYVQSNLGSLARRIQEYHDEHGEWPATLCEADEFYCEEGPRQEVSWGHLLIYSLEDGGFALCSLGRDGRPGGIGLDADLYSDHRNDDAARLPLDHFRHDTVTRGNRSFCTLIAVIAAVQYLCVQFLDSPRPIITPTWNMALAVALIVSATIVALLVTPFHIPSGH